MPRRQYAEIFDRTSAVEYLLSHSERMMLDRSELKRAVDMQQRSYRLLKWMASAVKDGFIEFKTAILCTIRGSPMSLGLVRT